MLQSIRLFMSEGGIGINSMIFNSLRVRTIYGCFHLRDIGSKENGLGEAQRATDIGRQRYSKVAAIMDDRRLMEGRASQGKDH